MSRPSILGTAALAAGLCLFCTVLIVSLSGPPGAPDTDWPVHGGDPGHRQYSPLGQITRQNVASLKVAWTFHAGDAGAGNRTQIQCNPIVVHGVLYATSPKLKVFALDAATGRRSGSSTRSPRTAAAK